MYIEIAFHTKKKKKGTCSISFELINVKNGELLLMCVRV